MLNRFDYVAGKTRSEDAAIALRDRTQAMLDMMGFGQIANITRIHNGKIHTHRVNVATPIEKPKVKR